VDDSLNRPMSIYNKCLHCKTGLHPAAVVLLFTKRANLASYALEERVCGALCV
jgi:hypothetical protein